MEAFSALMMAVLAYGTTSMLKSILVTVVPSLLFVGGTAYIIHRLVKRKRK